MGVEFIDVMKITNKKKRTSDNTTVINPHEGKPVMDQEYSVKKETIRIDEIKSARPWNKDVNQEISFEGGLTKIYLKGDGRQNSKDSKSTNPEMLIEESHESFSKRKKSIQLESGNA